MRALSFGSLLLASVLLVACETTLPGEEQSSVSSSSSVSSLSSVAAEESASSLPRETTNVSYTGVIQPSGISIYMEGTHRLVLSDGRFILLTAADDTDLDAYVGSDVTVHGAIRPTVEGNGMIMRVERIETRSSSSSSEESSESRSSSESSSEMSLSTSASSPPKTSAAATSRMLSSSVSSAAQSSMISSAGSAFEARVEAMAKEDFSGDRWTRSYCSPHIGFCFTYHKNWWHKSFGTTANALWHVEVSNTEIEMPGEGPIVVKLLSGELSGATDGQVKTEGALTTAYRSWTEGRHIEVSGPSALRTPIELLGKSIAPAN